MNIIKAKRPASTVGDIASGLSQQDKAPFAPPAGQDLPLEQGENSLDPTIICTTQDKPACPSLVNMSCLLSGVLSDVMNMTPEQWVDYVDTTPATALRKRFEQEANAHRAMKQRVKTKGAVVHPAFEDFKSFLTIVGPAPTKTATVDRIDPTNPNYGPGLVRWASKSVQATNKTTTITIHDPDTGETWTIPRLAKHRGISPDTLRKQRSRGASDYELIHGKPAPTSSASPELSPTSKQAYLNSPPRPYYATHVDLRMLSHHEMWMGIADKFNPTWEDVNHIEEHLFEWFPEVKDRWCDLDFIPLPRKRYPVGRWKQLFDMFPLDLEHLNAVNDYFVSERVPGGKAKVNARRREERHTLARKETEDRAKWEEWDYIRNQEQLPDLSPPAWAHLSTLGTHPLDAWMLYDQMQNVDEVRALDFEGFVLRLVPDEHDTPPDDNQLRRNLALEVAPLPPPPASGDKESTSDFDPADCAAPPEVDDEDDDEDEDAEDDPAAIVHDGKSSEAFEVAFWQSAEDQEEV